MFFIIPDCEKVKKRQRRQRCATACVWPTSGVILNDKLPIVDLFLNAKYLQFNLFGWNKLRRIIWKYLASQPYIPLITFPPLGSN